MATKYSTILVGGVVQTYNDAPPADDGSQTEANRGKYVTITGDLSSPLHSAITRMDAKLLDQVDEGPTTKSSAYTTTLADHNTVIECSSTFTLDLLAPSGNAGYKVIAKNAGSGVITVEVDGGGNVDGAASVSLGAGQSATYRVNAAGTAYYSDGGPLVAFPSGTAMLFYQDAAPPYWTIAAALDEHAVRLTKGSGAGGQAGGAIGGTHNFSTQFANLAESATPGIGDHTLTSAQSGVPAHSHPVRVSTAEAGGVTRVRRTLVSFSSNTLSGAAENNTAANASEAHSHTVDLRVKWAACIAATKD